jgi:GT2 family glycosyltransferase
MGALVVDELAVTTTIPLRALASPRGVGRQRNAGITAASGDVLVFLDDDVTVPGDLFARVASAFESQPDLVGVTGRVIEPRARLLVPPESPLRRFLPGGGVEGSFTRYGYPRYIYSVEESRNVEHMLGCFMAVRRDVARRVRFDELLDLAEDEDFAFRVSRLGRLLYEPRIVVHHRKLGFASLDARERDARLLASRRYIFRKNFEQTPLARLQFAMFVLGLIAHRVVNRDLAGLRGLLSVAFGGGLERDGQVEDGRGADGEPSRRAPDTIDARDA